MTGKLKIKAKGIEIEWEGDVAFLKNDLPDLIASLHDVLSVDAADEPADGNGKESDGPTGSFTTAALAAKVQPGSASELLKVALAKLQLSDKIEPATRSQILAEMKKAPKFYKPSMRGNLGQTINTLLTNGAINEPQTGSYALTQAVQEQMQAKINS